MFDLPVSTDSFKIFNDKKKEVPVLRTGIAWPSDKAVKFHNPPGPDLKEGEFSICPLRTKFRQFRT